MTSATVTLWLGVAACLGGVHAARVRRETPGVLELLSAGRARWTPAVGPAREGRATLHEQWPVTTVHSRAFGTTLVFWPDTLSSPGRRLLRRWARPATAPSSLPQFWIG